MGGCASTEFFYEGPGQPGDRASGAVPPGALGVCKRPGTKRPPIVTVDLWEHARWCSSRTPENFIRLGYGKAGLRAGNVEGTGSVEDDKNMEHLLGVLHEAPNEQTGNSKLVTVLKVLHENGLKDPAMRDRVARETSRASVCDYTYLLNTMNRERNKLEPGARCTVEVYDSQLKSEACLFDVAREEVVWLTSSWTCVSHTQAAGEQQSCYRLCGYDDYCAKQVSCAAPDIDLLLCELGVCLPVAKAGIY